MYIRNARDLARVLGKNGQLDSHKVPETVDGAVDEYLNTNWVVRGGSIRVFTAEQCLQKFNAELPDVQCAFQKLGFITELIPQVPSGILFRKKKGIPACLHVFISDDDMQFVAELNQE